VAVVAVAGGRRRSPPLMKSLIHLGVGVSNPARLSVLLFIICGNISYYYSFSTSFIKITGNDICVC